MCPSPPLSDDGSYDSESSSSEPRLPQELGALFVDFYSFMATLNYDKSELKIPPPTGWPEITSESCGGTKSDYAVEVLRHLPYFNNKGKSHIHYKSKLCDLTAWNPDDFKTNRETYDFMEFWSSESEQDPDDVVLIAEGYESFGRGLWLLVNDCEIIEDMLKANILSSVPVEEFFAKLKDQYERLQLIPGEDKVTIEAETVPERHERISEEEVNSQTVEWRTDLDVQYIRQVYRDYGWPHSFDSKAASKAINDWLEPGGVGTGEGPRGFAWEGQYSD